MPENLRRASDYSKWAKFGTIIEKYKSIFWLVVLIIVAAGFDFRTPKMLFEKIDERQNYLEHRDSVMFAQIEAMNSTVNTLVVLRCLDLTAHDKKLVEICNR